METRFLYKCIITSFNITAMLPASRIISIQQMNADYAPSAHSITSDNPALFTSLSSPALVPAGFDIELSSRHPRNAIFGNCQPFLIISMITGALGGTRSYLIRHQLSRADGINSRLNQS